MYYGYGDWKLYSLSYVQNLDPQLDNIKWLNTLNHKKLSLTQFLTKGKLLFWCIYKGNELIWRTRINLKG